MFHCFKKEIAATAVLFFCFGTAVMAQQPVVKKQPNIIFIFADDLGYADIGCYGQQKIETPNLDKLAKGGMKFTQFYSSSTVCGPARCSFFTGVHTGHAVIRGNKPFAPEGQTPLPDSVITLANLLQQNGYATAAFGKWGLGFNQNSGDPNKKGFDIFYGYNCQSLAHDYYPPYLWSNHVKVDLPINKTYDSVYSAALIQQHAIQYIQQAGSKPFFMYLPYTLPHGDVIGPHDSFYNYYAAKFNEAPLTGNKLKTREHNMVPEPLPHAQYAAMVGRLDRYVGEIIKTLAAKNLLENTLVIFTSDNGPHKENGGDPEFFKNTGIYRGIKRDLYEGGIRVPFIAYWKGKIQPGITDQWLALWDMYPTFQNIAGIPVTKNIDGISILPTLLKKGKQVQHDHLYWEFHENNGRQAIRWKNWKYIKLNVNTRDKVVLELYDLAADPSEKNNVAGKFPALVKKLDAIANAAHKPGKDWPLLPAELKGVEMVND